MSLGLRQKYQTAKTAAEKEKERQNLAKECIEACKSAKLFEVAFEDDKDAIYEEMEALSMVHLQRIKRIQEREDFKAQTYVELKAIERDAKKIQAKMNFVNAMDKQQKYAIIRALDFNRPPKYFLKDKDDKHKDFLLNWFVNGEQNFNVRVSEDSIMYPTALSNKLTMLNNMGIELRELSMDSEEDQWFVKELKTLPKIIHDQTMLAKLLPGSALSTLEDQDVQTSEFMRMLKMVITGSTLELIRFVYFAEDKKDQKYQEELYDRMIKLFGLVNNETDEEVKTQQTERNDEVFKKLQQFPQIQKGISKILTDPQFLKQKFAQFQDILKDRKQLENMVKMIGTLGKETQVQFYRNLTQTMTLFDNMEAKFEFHPEILAMKDKLSTREIMIEQDTAIQEGENTKHFMNKRYLFVDYPVLTYLHADQKTLIMVHLAGQKASRKVFKIEEEDQFISFVDRFSDSKDVQVSILVKNDQFDSLALIEYTFQNPFEKQDFNLEASDGWSMQRKQVNVSPQIKNLLNQQDNDSDFFNEQNTMIRKVSLIEKTDDENPEDTTIYKGLLIQTNEHIFFQDLQDENKSENLINDGLSVKLEMLRGLSDKFYYALRDDGAASDTLSKIKFYVDNGKLVYLDESIPAAYTGEILAFELDPLHSNCVDSLYHDNTTLDEWQDKLDRIFLIDGRLNLFKLELQREPVTLSQLSLTKISSVQTIIETQIRGKDFIRLGITDRCLMLKGRTINYHTGHEWDFIFNTDYDEPVNTMDDQDRIQVQYSQMLTYSTLQLALVTSGQKAAIMVKNDPSSRRLMLFDHRVRDVLLFEPLSDKMILAKMKGSDEKSNNYWTLMDYEGNILSMPKEMTDILKRKNWVTVKSKLVKLRSQGEIQLGLSEDESSEDESNDKKVLLIALSHYGKDESEDEQIENPFPNIGSVLIDIHKDEPKFLCSQIVTKKELVDDSYLEQEGNKIADKQKTFQSIVNKKLRFKIVISDEGEILLFYADPERKKKQSAIQKFVENSRNNRHQLALCFGAVPRMFLNFFKDDREPTVFGKSMFLTDQETSEVIFIRHEEDILRKDNQDLDTSLPHHQRRVSYNSQRSNLLENKIFTVTRSFIFIPEGNCILSQASPYYRSDLSSMKLSPPMCKLDEIDDCEDCHCLEFPKTVQITYENRTILCNLHDIKKIVHKQEGRHQEYRGIEKLFDPEFYVDTGITIRRCKEEICESEKQKLQIWQHVNASFSKDHYYVYQDWWWIKTKEENPRKYSFQGFFKKYCEADLYEVMRLQKLMRDQKAVRQVEQASMFANFKGNNLFHIFFREVKVLKYIATWLEKTEFPIEFDRDDNEIENVTLRRIYYIMACHTITKTQFESLTSQVSNPNQPAANQDENATCLTWCEDKLQKVKSIIIVDSEEKSGEERDSFDKQHVACNSLLYRILRSDNTKGRDLILQIASHCEDYSIQNFFISQDDVKCVLRQPSLQVQKAFDDVLVETKETKQILTLDVSFNEEPLITLWHSNVKVEVNEIQEKTKEKLKEMDAEDEDIMMNSVSVKLIKISWLREGGRTFLDLVQILNDSKNQQIISTKFVSCLLSGYWDRYFQKIKWTQFIPFVCYMVGMVTFLVYALQKEVENSAVFHMIYYPLFGYCFVFIVNQALCEWTQLQSSDTLRDYFTDYWNMNDLIYLVCNFIVMIFNLFGHSKPWQVTLSSISVCFLWFKVFDWLRLFDSTAFFIRLIQETIIGIRHFLVILVLCYMMFGSAFYIININLDEEHEIMADLSPIWILDAFQNQYELSIGEFEIDAYRNAETRKMLIYTLFLFSTFLIQITFLNMLIAIMGDTFDRATEERDNNARQTKLKIMGDYVDLISKDEKEDPEDNKALAQHHDIRKSYVAIDFASVVPMDSKAEDEVEAGGEQKSIKKEKLDDLLYVIQPYDDDSNENLSWEGHLATLKRSTEKAISKTEALLGKSLDKVLERVIEAESRDATQEREMKQSLDKVMKSVKEQIEQVKDQQKKQQEKQDQQFNQVLAILQRMQKDQGE